MSALWPVLVGTFTNEQDQTRYDCSVIKDIRGPESLNPCPAVGFAHLWGQKKVLAWLVGKNGRPLPVETGMYWDKA